MVTIERLIAAQDQARRARQAFLDSDDDDQRGQARAYARSCQADNQYHRCLMAYMAQQGMGKEVYAHIEAERAARAAVAA